TTAALIEPSRAAYWRLSDCASVQDAYDLSRRPPPAPPALADRDPARDRGRARRRLDLHVVLRGGRGRDRNRAVARAAGEGGPRLAVCEGGNRRLPVPHRGALPRCERGDQGRAAAAHAPPEAGRRGGAGVGPEADHRGVYPPVDRLAGGR